MISLKFIRNLFLVLSIGITSHAYSKGSVLDVPTKKSKISAREAAIFYANVAARIQKDYVEEVSHEELLEGALNGMLSSLDPHSAYLNKDKLNAIKNSVKGEYGGLGMEVIPKNGLIKIVSPMDGTPAARAGLKPGDYILKVDQKPVINKSLGDIIKKMQGKPGSKVTLTIRRNTLEPFDVNLSRAIIKVKAVKWKVIDNVGYIRIISFINKNTKEEVMKAIEAISAELGDKLKGYIIDLRNNAGGLLDQAVDVTDIFIKDKLVVSIKGREKVQKEEFNTSDESDVVKGKPIVVLINAGSASASEIVAGALQDYNRAVIVGTRSFGKGSVQVIMPMTNGGAVKMTTSLYYTPLGRSIQKEGVKPDVEIKQSYEAENDNDEKRVRESDFDDAIDLFGDDTDKTEDGDSTSQKVVDNQLNRAIDVLQGMSIYADSFKAKPNNKNNLVKTS